MEGKHGAGTVEEIGSSVIHVCLWICKCSSRKREGMEGGTKAAHARSGVLNNFRRCALKAAACTSAPPARSCALQPLHHSKCFLCAARRGFPWLQRWGWEHDSQIK